MKLKIFCFDCADKNNEDISMDVFITDSLIYEIECPRGHKNQILIGNLMSVIIFEAGLLALSKGFLRESISDFYAALENFYSEAIYVLSKKLSDRINDSMYEQNLKKHLKLSERKLGAYNVLYFLFLNEQPEKFSDDLISLRNSVVHATHYPTCEETLKMAEAVYKYISCCTRQIMQIKEHDVAMSFFGLYHNEKLRKKVKENYIMHLGSSYYLLFSGTDRISIKDYLPHVSLRG